MLVQNIVKKKIKNIYHGLRSENFLLNLLLVITLFYGEVINKVICNGVSVKLYFALYNSLVVIESYFVKTPFNVGGYLWSKLLNQRKLNK